MKQLFVLVVGMLCSGAYIYAEPFTGLTQCKDVAYRRDIYPYDQSLVIDLLQHAETIPDPQIYIQGVLKLFINIAKGTQYIVSDSFNTILKHCTELLPAHFTARSFQPYLKHPTYYHLDMLAQLKYINTNLLLHELNVNYETFRSDPSGFIDGLAEQLARIAHEEMEGARLRFTLLTFLEVHLNKLIWAPEDQVATWELVKSIAHNCALLVEKDILNDLNDLDDLYWTLVHRYSHFLDLTHMLLDQSLFDTIKRDIMQGGVILFELEEQDSCIEKRAECLLDAVMFAQAKKKAFEKGLISH